MEGKRSTIGVDATIFGISGRQHGVVTREQVRDRGVGDGAIDGRIAKGTLRVVHRGVYAVAGRPLGREGRWLAAVLACRGAVLSHWDAAELWAILPPRASRDVHVSVARNRKPRHHEGICIHRAPLEAEVVPRKGIPITTAARTLFDLAPLLPRRRLERSLDEAKYLHLLPAGALATTLERNAGRKGAPALRAALADHTPGSTRTRSHLEELFLAICRSHLLPQPLVNTPVAGLEVDFLWPAQRLIVETDGSAAHSRRTTIERDHERDAHLRDHDYTVLRFTYRQVTEKPGWIAASVRRELAKRT